jgi:hypothetical protein
MREETIEILNAALFFGFMIFFILVLFGGSALIYFLIK